MLKTGIIWLPKDKANRKPSRCRKLKRSGHNMALEAMTEMFRSIVSNQNKNQNIQQEQNLKQNQERPVDTGSARAREQNKKQNQDRP
jgi:hypothetical protein